MALGGFFFRSANAMFNKVSLPRDPEEPPSLPQDIENGDFEQGARGWSQKGPAFSKWPTPVSYFAPPSSRTAVQVNPNLVPVGGDYWQNSAFPPYPTSGPRVTGYTGNNLVMSDPNGQGSLESNQFMIPDSATGITFVLGALGRVENNNLNSLHVDLSLQLKPPPVQPVVVTKFPSDISGRLAPKAFRLSPIYAGKVARISIVDQSSGGQILADSFRIQFSDISEFTPPDELIVPADRDDLLNPPPVNESSFTENITTTKTLPSGGSEIK